MKHFVMGAIVLLFSVTSVCARDGPGYKSELPHGWILSIWDEKNTWRGCTVDKVFEGPAGRKKISLGFLLGRDSFKMALVFEEPVFFVTKKERTEYAFRVDGDKIFRGIAEIEKDVAFLVLDWDLEIVSEVQEGNKLEVKIGEKGYFFPLLGSRNALNNLLECYKLGLKSLQGD